VARAKLLLTPLERAPEQQLGLNQFALVLEQRRQVVHRGERARVVNAELPLAPLERTSEQRLGLAQPALVVEQLPDSTRQAPVFRLCGERFHSRLQKPRAQLAQHLLVEFPQPHARLHRAHNVGLVLGLGRLRLVQRDF